MGRKIMSLAPISLDAAQALFRQESFAETNTMVTVSKNTSTLSCHGKELAKLYYDPANKGEKPKLKIKNDGFFTAVNLNRLNAVLQRAGHEAMYRTNYNWLFESSQTPFGSGLTWRDIKL